MFVLDQSSKYRVPVHVSMLKYTYNISKPTNEICNTKTFGLNVFII